MSLVTLNGIQLITWLGQNDTKLQHNVPTTDFNISDHKWRTVLVSDHLL